MSSNTDLEYFKFINDNYGHIAGDVTLKQFSALLKMTCMDKRWVARLVVMNLLSV